MSARSAKSPPPGRLDNGSGKADRQNERSGDSAVSSTHSGKNEKQSHLERLQYVMAPPDTASMAPAARLPPPSAPRTIPA